MGLRPGRESLILVRTLAIAGAGGFAAFLLGVPAPWLLGSLVSVAAANLSGVRIVLPNWLRNVSFYIFGVLAGSAVTPDVLDQLSLWPFSIVIQLLGVALVVWLTSLFLQRAFGWDRQTAFFASLPGALSYVLAAASQTKADMTRVVVVQLVRLLALILFLAPLLAWFQNGDALPPASSALEGSASDYLLFLSATIGCAWIAHRFNLPGGLIVGALIASAVLYGGDIAPVSIPLYVVIPGFVVLGAFIGERVKPENRRAMMELFPASLGAFAVGIVGCAAAGVVAHLVLGIDYGRLALAYAPGALEVLTAIAYQFDIDPAYVAAHHVARFVVLALAIPFLARWIAGPPRAEPLRKPSETPLDG